MAKKKASNPVDAARKAARARELKKNKAEREKVREVVTVRKDTKGLEADIRRLESKERAGNLTKSDKSDLTDLKAELSRITEAKEAYVAAHPEHRKYVYGKEVQQGGDETVFGDGKKKSISNLSGSNTLSVSGSESGNGGMGTGMGYQRDPKRSVYYHEIFNPLGAPPPGMPYLEKPPDQWDPPFGIPTYTGPPPSLDSMTTTAEPSSSASISNQQVSVEDQADNEGEESEEDQEQDDEDEDEDEEISLPSGPAPPLPDLPSLPEEDPIGKDQDQDSDSDSDIVMPEGPPPPRKEEEDSDFQPPLPPIPTGAKSNHQSAPPPPPLPSGLPPSTNFNQPPPPIFYSGPPPPLPPSHLYSHPPPPLPLPNQFGHPPPPPGYGHPPNMRGNFNHRGGSFDGRGRGFDRGRGRGRGNFLPQDRRNPQFQQEVLDPLSADGKSHETFASHASKMREKSRSEATINQGKDSSSSSSGLNSLPSKPTSTPGAAGASKPSTASATISAEPQLRDLKKEVTAFLPPAMRRKLQKEKERKEMGLPDLNKLTSAPREEDQSGSGNGYGSNNNDGGSGYLEGWDDDDRQGNRNDTPSTNPKAREEFQTFEKPNLLNALKNQLNDPSKMGSRINVGSTGGNGSGKSNGEGNKKRKNDDYDKFLNEMGDLL